MSKFEHFWILYLKFQMFFDLIHELILNLRILWIWILLNCFCMKFEFWIDIFLTIIKIFASRVRRKSASAWICCWKVDVFVKFEGMIILNLNISNKFIHNLRNLQKVFRPKGIIHIIKHRPYHPRFVDLFQIVVR